MATQSGFSKLFQGLLMTSGFVAGSLGVSAALAIEALTPVQDPAAQAFNSSGSAPEQFNSSSLTNGVYLYGETQQPDQIGAAYMVMQVEGDRVVGALYMPRSSFDCFEGAIRGEQLDLTVVNSYDQSTQSYSMAVQNESYLASIDDPVSTPARLNGMYNLPEVSETDHRILETCKADFSTGMGGGGASSFNEAS